jgi:hypothetical protein
MKVSGFTFVRNALKYDYPVVESVTSLLPICDEIIVGLGNSTDETEALVNSIQSPKLRIIPSIWDDNLREGGRVLAIETDKAFDAVAADSDWAFYLQADEVIHEKYLETIQKAMWQYKDDEKVEGLLFKYLHFYGTYDYTGDSRRWYNREIRIIKNDKNIRSYRDAQGFRKHNKKLKVKLIDAYVYHYGWVKHPARQKDKEKDVSKFWHSDQWIESNVKATDLFDYGNVDSLNFFKETHPQTMHQRIAQKNWHLDFDTKQKRFRKTKDKVLYWFEKQTGIRLFDYQNYKLI